MAGCCTIILAALAAGLLGCQDSTGNAQSTSSSASAPSDPVATLATLRVERDAVLLRILSLPHDEVALHTKLTAAELSGVHSIHLQSTRRRVALLSSSGKRNAALAKTDGAGNAIVRVFSGAEVSGAPTFVMEGLTTIAIETHSNRPPTLPVQKQDKKLTIDAPSLNTLEIVNWRGSKSQRQGDGAYRLFDVLSQKTELEGVTSIALQTKKGSHLVSLADVSSGQVLLRQREGIWKAKVLDVGGKTKWRAEILGILLQVE